MSRAKSILEAHLVLTRDQEILLLRRYNTGYEDGNYSLVAGHFEKDESGAQAMVREAREEAGIEIDPDKLSLFHVMHRNTRENRVSFFFEADDWVGSIENREPHKCGYLAWFKLSALPDNTIPYIRAALTYGQRGIKYSEFGWSADA